MPGGGEGVKIVIGADHAGFALKQEIVRYLETQGHTVEDVGVHSPAPADYPDVAATVARTVASGRADRGIAICGTGVGMAITANKFPGIRAVVCTDTYTARMSREHNDTNVLCLGGRVLGPGLAQEIVAVWLQTAFSGAERHQRRLTKIAALEGAERAWPRSG